MEDVVRLIFDFRLQCAGEGWTPINDVVMGGLSRSTLDVTGQDTAVFRGVVSLENNGGFASVRSRANLYDLQGYEGVILRVRGDGKRYKLNLSMKPTIGGVLYRAAFESEVSAWQVVRLPFTAFHPTFRGRRLADAAPLDPGHVRAFELMISDRQAGSFALELAWMGAYAAE
jgi:monofunctional biosynthetic peptidoglycan transglycosylase